MTKRSGDTINRGPAPQSGSGSRQDPAGNGGRKDEDPSPGDRERGETSDADPSEPVDLDTVHDRAS